MDYFAVEKALETLFPLAEAAVTSSDKESSVIPSFKDIKDRLSRSHVHDDDDADDDDDDDDAASDERSQIEEENSFNEYQDTSLDLPLLPKNFSQNDGNLRVDDVPFSSDDAARLRNPGSPIYTRASLDLDRLLAESRETPNRHRDDMYSPHPPIADEIPPHLNGYYGDMRVIQPGPQRTGETGGTSYMVNQGPLLNSYYQPLADMDVASTQGGQDYLNTYYGDTFKLGHHSQSSNSSQWGTTQTDPKPRMPPQRRALHENTHRSNVTPNYTGTMHTGTTTAQSPSWPKKRSHITRSCKPPKQHNVEETVEPLPPGKVLCLLRGLPGSGKSTLAR